MYDSGGENKEGRGNAREKAGKKKKDGKRKNVLQMEGKRVSEEGLSGDRMVEDNKSREKEKTVDQKKKDDRRQSMQRKKGKRVSGEGLPGGTTVKLMIEEKGGIVCDRSGAFVCLSSSITHESLVYLINNGKPKKNNYYVG